MEGGKETEAVLELKSRSLKHMKKVRLDCSAVGKGRGNPKYQ